MDEASASMYCIIAGKLHQSVVTMATIRQSESVQVWSFGPQASDESIALSGFVSSSDKLLANACQTIFF